MHKQIIYTVLGWVVLGLIIWQLYRSIFQQPNHRQNLIRLGLICYGFVLVAGLAFGRGYLRGFTYLEQHHYNFYFTNFILLICLSGALEKSFQWVRSGKFVPFCLAFLLCSNAIAFGYLRTQKVLSPHEKFGKESSQVVRYVVNKLESSRDLCFAGNRSQFPLLYPELYLYRYSCVVRRTIPVYLVGTSIDEMQLSAKK